MYWFGLTGLSGSSPYRLTPGSCSNAVDGLNSDLILRPLLQVFDGELSLQAICNDVQQGFGLSSGPAVLHTVTHRIWVPVVLPFRKRLINRQQRERLSLCYSLNGSMYCFDCRTYHPSEPEAGFTGRPQGDICRGHIRRSLQGLDLSGRLAGWTGAHYVHLTHTEPANPIIHLFQ